MVRGPAFKATTQFLMEVFEGGHDGATALAVAEELERCPCKVFRRAVVLHELGNEPRAAKTAGPRQDVGQAVDIGFQHAHDFCDAVAGGRDAVAHHHGALGQHGFQRGGARGEQHGVGREHRFVGVTVGQQWWRAGEVLQQRGEACMDALVRGGHHDAQVGHRRRDPFRGVDEDGADSLDLTGPAARQHCEYGRVMGQAQRVPRAFAMRHHGEAVGEGVADETRVHAMLRVDRRLHREQAKHALRRVADLFRALLAPGPDGGADVMDRGQASGLELALDGQVEVRCVDADGERRLLGEELRE